MIGEKLGRAYKETGLLGVVRRSARVALKTAGKVVGHLEKVLYYAEARARLSPSELREAARAKANLTDLFSGETVFVIGTGPSLNDLNLEKVTSFATIGVNSFFRHPMLSHWNPTLYCFMDGNFFMETTGVDDYFSEVLSAMPRVRFVVTNCDLARVCERGLLPYERTYYVPTDGDLGSSIQERFCLGELLPSAQNSVMFAAFIAILAGAKTVVLVGADHDWLARPNFVQQTTDPHFCGGSEAFAPSTSSDDESNNLRSYYATIQYCSLIWSSYYKLRRLAAKMGARILNATPGTFLDVFEAVDYEWAVENLAKPQPGKFTPGSLSQ